MLLTLTSFESREDFEDEEFNEVFQRIVQKKANIGLDSFIELFEKVFVTFYQETSDSPSLNKIETNQEQ